MSALAPRVAARRGRFTTSTVADRLLLDAARRLELFVIARVQRRGSVASRRREAARTAADDRRRLAEAPVAFGVRPR